MSKKYTINLFVPVLVLTGLFSTAKLLGVTPFAEASWWLCLSPALLVYGIVFFILLVMLTLVAVTLVTAFLFAVLQTLRR